MASLMIPDQSYLKQCFDYDTETGILTWRKRPREHFEDSRRWKKWNTEWSGKIAGYAIPTGRRYVTINAQKLTVSNVIWKLHTGLNCPHGLYIDHKNRDKSDNRIKNLRIATPSQNRGNAEFVRKNKCGMTGVFQNAKAIKKGVFYSYITVENRTIYLGTFKTAIQAHNAYNSAAMLYRGEFWHGHSDKTLPDIIPDGEIMAPM